jgi:S-DNA-T family DNA segregation ATPase FtsK/SpoIIIE
VLGGTLLALSFLPGATGIPAALAVWQRRALGIAAPGLPVYVAIAGLIMIAAGERARFTRQIGGVFVGTAAAVMAIHLAMVSGDALAAGGAGRGAGLAGGALVAVATRALGRVGAWVVVVVLGIVGVGLVARVPLATVGSVLRMLARMLAYAVLALGRALAASVRLAARTGAEIISAITPTFKQLWRLLALAAASAGHQAAPFLTRATSKLRSILPQPSSSAPIPAPAGPPMDLMGARTLEAPMAPPREATASTVAVPAPDDGPARVEEEEAEPLALESLLPGASYGAPTGTTPGPDSTLERKRARRSTARDGASEGQGRLDFAASEYRLPPVATLIETGPSRGKTRDDPADTARALEHTLASFGVAAKVLHWEVGPVVTRFELQPEPGVRVQKVTSLTNDIALSLAAQSVRIEAPIPGKSAIGIELPNQKASMVHLREILTADEFQKATSPLVVGVGKDIAGHPLIADLTAMPHLLIAGATGSGKSVMLNAMIASILFRATPRQVRFVMIDPKRVELTDYNGIPHMLMPVVTNPRQAASVLKDMLRVMEQRFEVFAQVGARNIQSYNQMADVEPMYYIVIVIDELADLMMVAPADFEDIICRLAQMTRATGIHLMVATQRPSVDVVTGLIKANIPSRLAFAVSSQVDSRTILDTIGAEKLLGRGDMLFLPIGISRPIRAQGAYIADNEIRSLVEWWRQQGTPVYDQQLVQAQETTAREESADGERLIEAARLCVRSGYGSVSLLQRKMRIGYVTAARLIDELEARGVVGPVNGSNPRDILIGVDDLEKLMRRKAQD